jgi:hypothetical protein
MDRVFLLIAISFMKLPVAFLGLKERGISVYPERTLPPITTHQL